MKSISKEELIQDFKKLGIKQGDILNLKISMRAIGKVEGGPNTIIEALLDVVGNEGTLIADSFIKTFPLFLKFRNKNNVFNANSISYAGAITNAMIKHLNSFKSTHPVQRFTAIGKLAEELTKNFTLKSEPYDFLREMSLLDAKNLRVGGPDKVVGVGTTHVVIEHYKYKQKRLGKGIYYLDNDNNKKLFIENWADGCPVGFNNLLPKYKENNCIISESKVGNAESMLTSMKKTLEYEMELFEKDPSAFLCDNPACTNCSFNWDASKYSATKTFFLNLKNKNFKKALLVILIILFGKKYPRK